MNTNDLPLAQKLAALMEAGRAAHPEAKHIHGGWGNGKSTGCAMTFAAMGAGVDLLSETNKERPPATVLAEALGVREVELGPLMRRVIDMNDGGRASLDEIIAAVREDRLPERHVRRPKMVWLNEYAPIDGSVVQKLLAAQMKAMQEVAFKVYPWIMPDGDKITISMDVGASWDILPLPPQKVEAKPTPAKKLRVSAKTGKSWPVAKGCYA